MPGGSRLTVAFGADDDNECVRAVRGFLAEATELVSSAEDELWPAMASGVAKRVASGEVDVGVVMCWTGTGTAIAANKVPGVRAAQASDAWTARGARLWNDANVLALSLKRLAPDVAVECVRAFLETTEPDPEEAEAIALLSSLDR
jgi:ribose 5-phosphate isomerase B